MAKTFRRILISNDFAIRSLIVLATLLASGCTALQEENATKAEETEQVAAVIDALAHPSSTPTPLPPSSTPMPSPSPTSLPTSSSSPTDELLSTLTPEATSLSDLPFSYRYLTSGLYVVYVGTDNETYAISLDGNSHAEPIARIPGMAMSPDETQILYNDNDHLRILDLLSGQTSNLPGINKCWGGYSPDGKQVVCGG